MVLAYPESCVLAKSSLPQAVCVVLVCWCVQVQEEAPACDPGQEFAGEELVPLPQLLARFRVNQQDTLAVFKAVSVEDFGDVASLLPRNTALPAADKMTYLLARLEVRVRCGSWSHTAGRHCMLLGAEASSGVQQGCMRAAWNSKK